MKGGDVIELCVGANAPQCAAIIAADAMRVADESTVVVLAMATPEGNPAAFMIFDSNEDVEMVVERLRAAAKDAFKDQPRVVCDS